MKAQRKQITAKKLEQIMAVCHDCMKRNNTSAMFLVDVCDDCFVWTDLKNVPKKKEIKK